VASSFGLFEKFRMGGKTTTSALLGFARLSPWQARIILAVWIASTSAAIYITTSDWKQGFADAPTIAAARSDVDLYRTTVQRMAAGEPYYPVMAEELLRRGYPTASIFNWRTPLPMWIIANLPSPVLGKAILGVLSITLVLAAFELLARKRSISTAILGVLLLTGPLLLCILGDLYVTPMLWAGVLIALSVVFYGLDKSGWAVVFGLAALFMRDLAGPYCALAAGMALWNRNYRELTMWMIGLVIFAIFFGYHITMVDQYQTINARAHDGGWVKFGGAPFIISVAQVSAYLLLIPQWVSAIYLSLAMLAMAAWSDKFALRLALPLLLYLALFAAIGNDFNQYWGALLAPTLCLAVATAPRALACLYQNARLTGLTRLSVQE